MKSNEGKNCCKIPRSLHSMTAIIDYLATRTRLLLFQTSSAYSTTDGFTEIVSSKARQSPNKASNAYISDLQVLTRAGHFFKILDVHILRPSIHEDPHPVVSLNKYENICRVPPHIAESPREIFMSVILNLLTLITDLINF